MSPPSFLLCCCWSLWACIHAAGWLCVVRCANCNKGAMIASSSSCQMARQQATHPPQNTEQQRATKKKSPSACEWVSNNNKRAIKLAMNSANGVVIELGFVLTKLKSRGHLAAQVKNITYFSPCGARKKGCRRISRSRGRPELSWAEHWSEQATKNIYAIPSACTLPPHTLEVVPPAAMPVQEYLLFIKPNRQGKARQAGRHLLTTHSQHATTLARRMKWRRQHTPFARFIYSR